MHRVNLTILLAFVSQAQSKGPLVNYTSDAQYFAHTLVEKPVDELGNKLIVRAQQVSPLQDAEVDSTTLGKPSHVATPVRTSLRHLPPLTYPQSTLSGFALSSATPCHYEQEFIGTTLVSAALVRPCFMRPHRRPQTIVARAKGSTSNLKEPEEVAEKTPRRIVGRVGRLSIKRQKRMIRKMKSVLDSEDQDDPSSNAAKRERRDKRPTKKFRKQKMTLEERKERLADLEKATKYVAKDNRTVSTRILIVDGYNVCGAARRSLSGLQDDFASGRVESASGELTRELNRYQPYSAYNRIICVFDSSDADVRNGYRPTGVGDKDGVQVHYATNADEWIRQKMKDILDKDGNTTDVYVASNDFDVKRSAEHESGAFGIRADALVSEIIVARRRTEARPRDWYQTHPTLGGISLGDESRGNGGGQPSTEGKKASALYKKQKLAALRRPTFGSVPLVASIDLDTWKKIEARRRGERLVDDDYLAG